MSSQLSLRSLKGNSLSSLVLTTRWERICLTGVSQPSPRKPTTWWSWFVMSLKLSTIHPTNGTLCDECAAGPKSTDHTLTFFDHFVRMYIDKWVRHLTLCLDNVRICKNQYLVAWAMELVEKKRFDSVRFIYLTVGHTKFAPDQLFSSIAKTFYNSDVLFIEMLHHITQEYATSLVFTSRLMQHWKTALEQKYTAIPGITEMHDISVSKLRLGKTTVTQRRVCCNGEYTALRK